MVLQFRQIIAKLLKTAVLLPVFIFYYSAFAQFPYSESFRNSTAPGILFGGAPTAFLTAGVLDPEGQGYLRLTNNTLNQKGYIVSTSTFTPSNGLRIEFEYFTYGGDGADGITFFLFNALSSPFNIGGFGGSLGYAQNLATIPVSPGVSGGYLGIGLDEYGNFSNPTEGRQGGPGASFQPGSVTLRGSGNGSATTPDNYTLLTTVKTNTFSQPFDLVPIGNTQRNPLIQNPGYRKASIDLKPDPTGGYDITVRITTGGSSPSTVTVINNYHYTQAAPSLLRYGIASSTGAQTNFHEIRNVSIDLYNPNLPPVANADNAVTPLNTPVTIDILNNDSDPDGFVDLGSVTIKSQPLHGTLTYNAITGKVIYTPFTGYIGPDTFTYTVKDYIGLESNVATVSISVSPISAIVPPVAVNDSRVTNTNTPIAIDVTQNDTSIDGTIDKTTIALTSSPLNGTALLNNVSGIFTYTPAAGFSGKDRFTYTVKSSRGVISNIATVFIDVKPVGANDQITTRVNTDVLNFDLKSNDISKNNTTVQQKSGVSHGVITFNLDGTVNYKPVANFKGTDTFTYTLKTADGLESEVITVNILVLGIPPVANNDNSSTQISTPVIIDIPANDTDADGTIDRKTVVIKTQPLHGNLFVDPLTGKVTYTPAASYVGPDSFNYTIKDNDDNESNSATVNILIRPVPKIGLSKAPLSIIKNVSGSYDIKYLFSIKNYGDETLSQLTLTDDLQKAFPGAQISNILVTATRTLSANAQYNGNTNIDLILPVSTLEAGGEEQVLLQLTVRPLKTDGVFLNTADASGKTPSNVTVTDKSTNGLKPDPVSPGDVSPAEPTPVTLIKTPVFVPGGFSPNNDGKHDKFILNNSAGRIVSLEIYNRWGNKVYKSADYQDDWTGKCNQGIHLGEDVPDGTYYYIVVVDNIEKLVGFITIQR